MDLALPFILRPPLLVFGGPYSNLQATLALKAEAERRGIPPDRIICTGDVVAYCGQPEETVAAIRDWGIHVIQGNCEEQLAAGAGDCGCGFEEGTACDRLSKSWYEFADRSLSPESRAWMGALPRTLDVSVSGLRLRVIHGGTRQINRFVFASQTDVLSEEMTASGADLVLAGHCGLPFARAVGRGWWLNPGVVGMPANDGTPHVWYGLIEEGEEALRFSVHALDYDHAAAARPMRNLGYADAYADCLSTGLWPSLDVLPPAERAATGMALKPFSQALRRVVRASGGHAAMPIASGATS